MLRSINQFFRAWINGYRASAPASTFLVATVFTLAVAFTARFAIGAVPADAGASQPADILVSDRAIPGGIVEVAVESGPSQTIRAYLPGLDSANIDLDFDVDTGYHLGKVSVPSSAPEQGYCTLRVVFADGAETDLQVALGPPPTTI